MDKGLLTRILGFISIPIILRGIVSLIMREKEREMTYNLRKERIVIRPPKVIGWIAVMEMLFCTTVLLIILLYQNGIEFPVVFHGTESPVVFLGFFLFLYLFILFFIFFLYLFILSLCGCFFTVFLFCQQ